MKILVKSFLVSLVIFLIYRGLALLSFCYYNDIELRLYWLDPFSPCASSFKDVVFYHWAILIIVLPTLSFSYLRARKLNRSVLSFVLFAFLALLLFAIFIKLIDLPFARYWI